MLHISVRISILVVGYIVAPYKALHRIVVPLLLASHRSDRDLDVIELVLTIIRNLLHVPDLKVRE
jgi:hypothetical protein